MGNNTVLDEIKIEVCRITKENYHMYDDMVYWRRKGAERCQDEKAKNKENSFDEVDILLTQSGFYAYGALVEGRYVGWITLIHVPKIGKWNKGVIYVEELWTAPEYRRRGIAYRLMGKAFEIQNAIGAVKVRLYTNTEAARKLYEKCGLKVTAKEVIFMESSEE